MFDASLSEVFFYQGGGNVGCVKEGILKTFQAVELVVPFQTIELSKLTGTSRTLDLLWKHLAALPKILLI